MQLGVIGLGRMGRIVVDRVLAEGHEVVMDSMTEAELDNPRASGCETRTEAVMKLVDWAEKHPEP